MAETTRFLKDPDAVLDFEVDWTAWLVDDETIQTSTFTAPVGITIDTNTHLDTVATVWLSGGTKLGAVYAVVNEITTTAGRTDDRTLYIKIQER